MADVLGVAGPDVAARMRLVTSGSGPKHHALFAGLLVSARRAVDRALWLIYHVTNSMMIAKSPMK